MRGFRSLPVPILLTLAMLLTYTSEAQSPNSWTQKASFGGAIRNGAVGFSIGSKGYMGTGADNFGATADFWEYDPATNAWTQKASFAGDARYSAVGFSIGNKGYIGTGMSTTVTYYNDFWEYDPAANTWTQKASFTGAARQSAVGFGIGSKGYLGTGMDVNNQVYSDLYEYDPATDAWTQKASYNAGGRMHATGFSMNGKGYVGTGAGSGPYYKDFWEYDPAANSWVQKANLTATGRYGAAGFSIGGKGYIGTGDASGYLIDFWEYDGTTNTWTQKANCGNVSRLYASGFSIGNRGYIGLGYFGNSNNNVTGTFWEYTPGNTVLTGSWSTVPYCAGSALSVPFTATGTYAASNVFTAQLSDASGSFANPVAIGTLPGTSSGTIAAILPPGTLSGTGYRIRVVSSAPAFNGPDNGADIIINAIQNTSITVSTPATTICAGATATFSATAANGGTAPVYQWQKNNQPVGTNSTTYTDSNPLNGDVYRCILTGSTPCATAGTDTSNVVVLSVHPLPQPMITRIGGLLHAGIDTGFFQWYRNGQPVSGATDSTFLPALNGSYTVRVSDSLGCSGMSAPFIIANAGVATIGMQQLIIFPNPAGSVLNVQSDIPVTATIFSTDGQRLLQLPAATRVDISNLAPGLYLLEVRSRTWPAGQVFRFVKQ